MGSVVIDFSKMEEPQGEGPAARRMPRARLPETMEERRAILPTARTLAGEHGDRVDPALLEAAKATFIATGGNLARVAKEHDLEPNVVKRLASKHDWPVYGEGYTLGQKSRRTRLEKLADTLERQVHAMAEAMGVETKELGDITQHGMMSKYVAPLSQRSSAFAALFDRYMRVAAILEPELFGQDDDPSNPVAARLRQKAHQDALGGVEGVNRQMADFAARVATGVMDHLQQRSDGAETIIDVTAVDE